MEKILSKTEVAELTGMSTVTIWRREKELDFPPRRQISRGRVGYLLSEVERWMSDRPQVFSR